MKNVQVIDGGLNCTFSIFQMTSDEFAQVFPGEGQDIEFAKDLSARLGDAASASLLAHVWERPVRKAGIAGLHGTLFFQFDKQRRYFPGSKRERDWDRSALNHTQRKLYGV